MHVRTLYICTLLHTQLLLLYMHTYIFTYILLVQQIGSLQVLETRKGIPITMCCVYAAVAKRLGLKLEPVSTEQLSL